MRKVFLKFIIVVFLLILLNLLKLFIPDSIYAQAVCPLTINPPTPIDTDILCQNPYINFELKVPKESFSRISQLEKVVLKLDGCTFNPQLDFSKITQDPVSIKWTNKLSDPIPGTCDSIMNNMGWHKLQLLYLEDGSSLCNPQNYQVLDNTYGCELDIAHTDKGDTASEWTVYVKNINPISAPIQSHPLACEDFLHTLVYPGGQDPRRLSARSDYWKDLGRFDANDPNHPYIISVYSDYDQKLMCSTQFNVAKLGNTPIPINSPSPTPSIIPTPSTLCSSPYQCVDGGCSPPYIPAPTGTVGYGRCTDRNESCCLAVPLNCGECARNDDCSSSCSTCPHCLVLIPSNTPIPLPPDLTPLCEQVGTDFQDTCEDCVIGHGGMWTAIGCLPTSGLESFLKDYLFTFGIGIAGGIAFLYFLYGSFLYLTSAGNAETVGQAKEIIISALSGLIFILLSIFFLKIIGADILRIPGFG